MWCIKKSATKMTLMFPMILLKFWQSSSSVLSLLGALSNAFANSFSSSLRCKISHLLVSLITWKYLSQGQVNHSFETKSGKQAPTSQFLYEGRSLICQFRKHRWPNQLANLPFPVYFSIDYSTDIAQVLQSFLPFVSAANSLFFSLKYSSPIATVSKSFLPI